MSYCRPDSISGERERVTLEGILLTPASRRQIVFGKLVAAVSPWPVALAITIPFWIVLSRGDSVIKIAVIWGPALGTLLAPAMAGMGILVSLWSNTNKSSMLVSQGLYLLLLLPNELMAGPAKVQRTAEQWLRADFLDWINPLAATSRFLFKTFMNNLQPVQLWFWLTMPVLFTLFILAVLFLYAGPRLRLDAETARMTGMLWGNWQRRFGVTTAPGR
jgi:ABC-type transport system involved in multi-copper enzyme maturation permease subunit